MLSGIVHDLRFALRSFSKSPLLVAVATVSLALGIGANTAIFTLFDQVLLRLLPVKDPASLVIVATQGNHVGEQPWPERYLLSHVQGLPGEKSGL